MSVINLKILTKVRGFLSDPFSSSCFKLVNNQNNCRAQNGNLFNLNSVYTVIRFCALIWLADTVICHPFMTPRNTNTPYGRRGHCALRWLTYWTPLFFPLLLRLWFNYNNSLKAFFQILLNKVSFHGTERQTSMHFKF
jgi:hypothetical protein